MTDREQKLRLIALNNVVKKRLDKLKPGTQSIELPGPTVINDVNPTPIENHNYVATPVNNVTINTDRLAQVINCMTDNVEVITAQMAQQQQQMTEAIGIVGKTLSLILQLLTRKQPDVHEHSIAPEFKVVAEMPETFFERPRSLPKRKIKVTHSDGTESIIEEQ